MSFTRGSFTNGHAKVGGRRKGSRNKRTIAVEDRPDALDHIEAVIASTDDPTITPELRLRAAISLAAFQHPRPAPLVQEVFIGPLDYTAPKTVEEARVAILTLGERLAKGEISVMAHDALVGGLKAYLGDKAAEQEKILARLEASLRESENREL